MSYDEGAETIPLHEALAHVEHLARLARTLHDVRLDGDSSRFHTRDGDGDGNGPRPHSGDGDGHH